jgi:hypothetical protein
VTQQGEQAVADEIPDQRLKTTRSLAGMPSISAMTMAGSGTAKSAITSKRRPRPACVSSSSVSSSMRALSRLTARGVKGLVHQPAQTRVVGRVAAQHRRLVGRAGLGEPILDVEAAQRLVVDVVPVVGRKAGVDQHAPAVRVAEDDPAANRPAAMDRIVLTRLRVERIGVGAGLPEKEMEDVARRDALPGQQHGRPDAQAGEPHETPDGGHRSGLASLPPAVQRDGLRACYGWDVARAVRRR